MVALLRALCAPNSISSTRKTIQILIDFSWKIEKPFLLLKSNKYEI